MTKSKLSYLVVTISIALLASSILALDNQLTQNQYQENSLFSLKNIKRNDDGSHNNLENPKWGATHIPLKRQIPGKNSYEDGHQQPRRDLPSPRQISNTIGTHHQFQKNSLGLNLLYVIWGQFLDHDVTLSPHQQGQYKQFMNITIPYGDNFFDPQRKGNKWLEFIRSKFEKIDNKRQQLNQITAWVDASNVYGSSQKTANQLRSFKDGKLKTSEFNYLPLNEKGFGFLAGDIRANQNFALTAIHTIWVREHNRICDLILSKNTYLTDEQIYRISRNYVTGLIQKITFDDFVPRMIGPKLYQKYFLNEKKYNKFAVPDITNEFSTGIFRVGHSLLNDDFPWMNEVGQVTKALKLTDAFARPDLYNKETSIDEIFMGLMSTPAKQKTCSVIDSVRNFLVLDAQNRQVKLDLFALNINRARDHGIISYNELRKAHGFYPINSFWQLSYKYNEVKNLNNVYNSPNEMDLFVGIICERPIIDAVLGELGAQVVAKTFKKLRDGDRFYYEWAFPSEIVKQIKATSFGDVINRNTKLTKSQSKTFDVLKHNTATESTYSRWLY